MREAIPPLPNTPSWRDAQLKKAQRQLYLYLYFYEYQYGRPLLVQLISIKSLDTVLTFNNLVSDWRRTDRDSRTYWQIRNERMVINYHFRELTQEVTLSCMKVAHSL
jgi:hypothetical protein